ncbi:hypothetical protein [Ruficoccus sp. ZRK36]|nr:hypothetical protein [Ruficoccus sp. ZRK36]QYY35305.1 hypothetical protein K0V07_13515 [Ruficoccus sp. ZRK36]
MGISRQAVRELIEADVIKGEHFKPGGRAFYRVSAIKEQLKIGDNSNGTD